MFQLRVRLAGSNPEVWRRLLVPGQVRLDVLHHILQAAVGWTNSHLHSFQIGDALYGMGGPDPFPDDTDEKQVTVERALEGQGRFVYEYDFGDSWNHEVVIERVSRMRPGLKQAVCLDGQNACPPEDCGGVHGYSLMLEALGDPSHEEHHEYLEWVGDPFDPTEFDLAAANAALQRVR